MTTTNCQQCGADSHAKTCWLCEIEDEGGYIYIKITKAGKIILWSSTSEDGQLMMKITAAEFCKLVRLQYPRGE